MSAGWRRADSSWGGRLWRVRRLLHSRSGRERLETADRTPCSPLVPGPLPRLTRRFSLVTLHLSLVTALLAAGPAGAASAPKPTLERIGNKVQCPCGCVAPLNQCPHADCAQRAEIQAIIAKDIEAGKDEQAILDDLSRRYGVAILSAPPARGFNLAAWLLPGLGLIVGLAVVLSVARRWWRKPAAASGTGADQRLLEAVVREMEATRRD